MTNALNQATLMVNNEIVKYKPNSLNFMPGTGEVTSRAQMIGNGKVSVVNAVDGSTMIGEVKFALENTIEASDLVDTLSLKKKQNEDFVIQIIYSDKTYSFKNMTLTNNPEYQDSADGEISLEFKGDPAI